MKKKDFKKKGECKCEWVEAVDGKIRFWNPDCSIHSHTEVFMNPAPKPLGDVRKSAQNLTSSKRCKDKLLEDKPVKVEEWGNEIAYWINQFIEKRCDRVFLRRRLQELFSFNLSEQRERIKGEVCSEIAQYSPISAKATRDLIKLVKSIKK